MNKEARAKASAAMVAAASATAAPVDNACAANRDDVVLESRNGTQTATRRCCSVTIPAKPMQLTHAPSPSEVTAVLAWEIVLLGSVRSLYVRLMRPAAVLCRTGAANGGNTQAASARNELNRFVAPSTLDAWMNGASVPRPFFHGTYTTQPWSSCRHLFAAIDAGICLEARRKTAVQTFQSPTPSLCRGRKATAAAAAAAAAGADLSSGPMSPTTAHRFPGFQVCGMMLCM